MRRQRPRHGVTLLELLIAIAIVLAMAALTLPNLTGRLQERRFHSAVDTITHQLLLARAHAQATGEAVEVRYLPPQNEFTTLSDNARDVAIVEARLFALDIDGQSSRILEPWANRQLPRNVRLSHQIPEQHRDRLQPAGDGAPTGVEDGPGDAYLLADPVIEGDSGFEPMRIVVYLPDGSAWSGKVAWLFDDDDHLARLDIQQWSGQPSIQIIEPGRDIAEPDEPQDELDELDEQDEIDADSADDIEDPSPTTTTENAERDGRESADADDEDQGDDVDEANDE